MDIDYLRYFVAAAKREHFGKAADALAVSQPAMSRGIARLEEFYGVALFHRDGRGVHVTSPGRAVLRRAERVIAELDDARRELHDVSQERRSRPIALGFSAPVGLRMVPEAVREFCIQHPGADFRLLQGPSPTLQQRLLSGEIDLCLSAPQFAEPSIEWLPLWKEELVLIVPATHRAAAQTEGELLEFASDPFVALKGNHGLRQTVDNLCKEAGFVPTIAVEGERVATVHGLVASGFGVAIIPKLPAAIGPNVALIHLQNPHSSYTYGLSWARGRYLPHATVEFRDFLANLLQHRSDELKH